MVQTREHDCGVLVYWFTRPDGGWYRPMERVELDTAGLKTWTGQTFVYAASVLWKDHHCPPKED